MAWLVAVPALALLPVPFVVNERLLSTPDDRMVAELNAQRYAELVADKDCAAAMAWITGRADLHLFGDGGELEYGLERDRERDALGIGELQRVVAGDHAVALLLKADVWGRTRERLPTPDRLVQQRGIVLAVYDGSVVAPSLEGGS